MKTIKNINEENKLRNDQTMDLHSYILLEKFSYPKPMY